MESLISILVPCRNEHGFIHACLNSVRALNVPPGYAIEILVLDGDSDDGTRAIVAAAAASDPRIRLLDNPDRTTPHALNVGIKAARGSWILRLDAHTVYPVDYIVQCHTTAVRTGAANVGGICQTEAGGTGFSAQLVQALTTHRFGVGNSGFRTGASEGPSDTVPFGYFPRALFESIGWFDERLTRNQDYEFNRRIIHSGRTVWLNPEIRSRYFNQPSLGAFLRKQIGREAPYNPFLWYLAPYAFTWRHAITAVFVLGLVAGAVLSPITPILWPAYLAVLALYAVLAVLSSLQQAVRYRQPAHVLVLPFAFLAYHFVHGLGVWRGIVLLLVGRAPVQTTKAPWAGATHRRWNRAARSARPAPST